MKTNMRCLYCGNELALLKKLTGGSEFCSEAHRQSYQDEYNRLALGRLLQNPSRPEEASPAKKAQDGHPPTPVEPLAAKAASVVAGPSSPPTQKPAPPEAGFLKTATPPAPAPRGTRSQESAAAAEAPEAQKQYVPFSADAGVSMPAWPIVAGEAVLATAQVVTIKLAERRWDSPPRRKEKPLEGRDFARAVPAVEPHLNGIEGRGLSLIKEPIELLAAPVAPPPPRLWQDAWLVLALDPRFAETARLELDVDRADWGQTTPAENSAVRAGDVPVTAQAPVAPSAEHSTAPANQPNEVETEKAGGETKAVDKVLVVREVEDPPVEPRPSPSLADLWRRSFFEESAVSQQPEAATDAAEAATESEVPTASEIVEPVAAPQPAIPEPASEGPAAPVLPSNEVAAEPEAPSAEAEVETVTEASTPAEPPPVEPEPEAGARPETFTDLSRLQQGVAAASAGETPSIEARAQGDEVVPPCPSIPVETRGIAPGKSKLVQSFQAISVTTFRMNLPRITGLPMRPKFTFGPPPAESKFKLRTVEPKPADSQAPAAPEPDKAAPVKITTRSERLFPPKTEVKISPPQTSADARPAAAAGGKTSDRTAAPENKAAEAQPADSKPAETPARTAKTAPPKTNGKAASSAAVESKDSPAQADKPLQAQSDLDRLRDAAAVALDAPRLGLETSDIGSPIGSFWKRLPIAVKIFILLVLVAGVAGIVWTMKDTPPKAGPRTSTAGVGPSIMIGEGGWITDWAGDAAGPHRGRQIQIYRPSLNMSDYRMEFQGTIESKAIGWVFRAANPSNYYAMKLEMVKPGLSPTVVLAKFAVVDGEDSPREQIPLPFPVRLDTVYKVRLDVRGSRFTTSIQDQVIDRWTDERLKNGGVGFFYDRGERGENTGLQIYLLTAGR